MELSIDSAFSIGGLVGHLSYVLLVVSMLMRRIGPLRVFALASAIVAILYDIVWLKDPIGAFWESLLAAVNIGQLALIHFENRRARFSAEEMEFMGGKFPGLSAAHRRKLLNQGSWENGQPGVLLTREGEPVDRLYFLTGGRVHVSARGEVLTACEPGSFIGEMTVLSGEPATGTAVVAEPSRYWSVEAVTLRNLVKRMPEIGRELEASFGRNLREKLLRSNRFVVDPPGK